MLHAFAGSLQTPRGDLVKRSGDAESLEIREVAMDWEYAKFKYSFRRRRSMEISYGHEVAKLIAEAVAAERDRCAGICDMRASQRRAALKIAATAERIRKQRALLEVRADADILRAETDAFRMCGMRIVGTPLMPEGYMALVSGNSATIIGPKGVWTITDDGFRVLAALADHDAGVK